MKRSTTGASTAAVSVGNIGPSSSNVGSLFECIINGSIKKEQRLLLINILRGLCISEENFNHWVVVFNSPFDGKMIKDMVDTRAYCDLNAPKQVWKVRYYTKPAVQNDKLSTIRSVTDVNVSSNVLDFLKLMGYRVNFEFVQKGQVFYFAKNIAVTVSQIYRLPVQHDYKQLVNLDDNNYLIEISSITNPNAFQTTTEDMIALGNCFFPFTDIIKVGPAKVNERN